ncbi:MAG: hypothetical protein P4L99_28370 [Chthoniobacter sp.]|nr:hypothetical protein [Chthoniobacter sp.]
MKARLLSVLFLVLLSVGSYGVVTEEQLTPQNITNQPFKFTIAPRTDGLGLLKITIEAKEPSQALPAIVPLLVVRDGEKIIAEVRPLTVTKDNRIEVLAFHVSAEYLAKSILEFDMGAESNGIAVPSGTSFWFYLKDFVAP